MHFVHSATLLSTLKALAWSWCCATTSRNQTWNVLTDYIESVEARRPTPAMWNLLWICGKETFPKATRKRLVLWQEPTHLFSFLLFISTRHALITAGAHVYVPHCINTGNLSTDNWQASIWEWNLPLFKDTSFCFGMKVNGVHHIPANSASVDRVVTMASVCPVCQEQGACLSGCLFTDVACCYHCYCLELCFKDISC